MLEGAGVVYASIQNRGPPKLDISTTRPPALPKQGCRDAGDLNLTQHPGQKMCDNAQHKFKFGTERFSYEMFE